MKLKVAKQLVVAKTRAVAKWRSESQQPVKIVRQRPSRFRRRKLRGTWTIEVTQDLQILHSLNLEAELARILGVEIAND